MERDSPSLRNFHGLDLLSIFSFFLPWDIIEGSKQKGKKFVCSTIFGAFKSGNDRPKR
jgi:hypothetical protein